MIAFCLSHSPIVLKPDGSPAPDLALCQAALTFGTADSEISVRYSPKP